MQLLCRNENAESEKILGEMQSTGDCGQSRQSCSGTSIGSLRFLCQCYTRGPSHSRTFLAGGARPAWEALAAPIPSQAIVTNAIVTGTFCGGDTDTTVTPARAHQQPCCHFTGCSAPNPTHQTVGVSKENGTGVSALDPSLPGQKAQEEITCLCLLQFGGQQEEHNSTAEHMLGLRMQTGPLLWLATSAPLLLSLSQRPGSHWPVSES